MYRIDVDEMQVEVTRKRVRRFNLHVTPEKIWISVPLHANAQQVSAFLQQHVEWIRAQRAACVSGAQNDWIQPDSSVLFWGNKLPVVIKEACRPAATMSDGQLTLCAPAQDSLCAALNVWYRQQLAAALPAVRSRWETAVGAQAAECRIRDMRTRWGTCSLRPRRIWINLRLVRYPPQCLDYVMVHELTHLLVPNHSAAFWERVGQVYPNWRAVRAQLRT